MSDRHVLNRSCAAHRGYQTSTPGADEDVTYAVPPAREADRAECPHYLACLARSAAVVSTGRLGPSAVCRPGCDGTPAPTLEKIVAEAAAAHGTSPRVIRRGGKWPETCAARRTIWERGNLLGYTDTELARATGVTRQTVGEWLDQPRRAK